MGKQADVSQLRNNLENLQREIEELESLMHVTLEGIRTDNVGPNEVIDSISILYQLTKSMAKKLKGLRKQFKCKK